MNNIGINIRLNVDGLKDIQDLSTSLVRVAKDGVETSGALDKIDAAMGTAAVTSLLKATRAIAAQTAAWLSNTAAIKAGNLALAQRATAESAATAAQTASGTRSLGAFLGKTGGKGTVVLAGASLAAMALSSGSNARDTTSDKWLGAGANIASGALVGATIGSIIPGIGTAVGAGVGAGVAGIVEVTSALTAETDAEKREAESLKTLAAAAQTAQPALENLAAAMREWSAQTAKSLYDRTTLNTAEIGSLGAKLDLSPEQSHVDGIRDALDERQLAARLRLHDPDTAAAAAEELKVIAQQFSAINALAAAKERLDAEERQRDLAGFRARQALDLEEFQTEERDAKDLHEFRLRQLDALHAKQREIEDPEDHDLGELTRATERARLVREGKFLNPAAPKDVPNEEKKASPGKAPNLAFTDGDANARAGLNVSILTQSSTLYQRNLLTENQKMHTELRLIRENTAKLQASPTAVWGD